MNGTRPDWMNHDGSFEHRGERDVESPYTLATFTR